jgi:hypothetical protein
MNNSIIPYEEYRELLKKQQVLGLKVMIGIFLITSTLMIAGGLYMYFIADDEWFILMIPAGIMLVISIIFMFVIKNYRSKPYNPFTFEKYKEYETTGTKVPLYRVVSTGKSSQTIYMLLDISEGSYKLFDIRRKALKSFFESSTANVRVKFFYKLKNGLEVIKPRIHFFVNGKKYSLFGYPEVNDQFLDYLKNEGLKYEVQIGRNKSIN